MVQRAIRCPCTCHCQHIDYVIGRSRDGLAPLQESGMHSAASSGATLCLVTVGGPAGGEEHVKSRASEAVKPGKALHSQVCNGVCLLTMDQGIYKSIVYGL